MKVVPPEEILQRDHSLHETSASMLQMPRNPAKKRNFTDGDLFRRHKLLRKEYIQVNNISYRIGDVVLMRLKERIPQVGRIISFFVHGNPEEWHAEVQLYWEKGPSRVFGMEVDPPQYVNEVLYDDRVVSILSRSILKKLDIVYSTNTAKEARKDGRITYDEKLYCWRQVTYVSKHTVIFL